jgi:CheY-like chemotaxis protein
VLEDIRADEALKNIPVVVLTASQTEKDRLKCELHDVASYITKPVNLDKFLSLVKQLKRYWLEDVILPSV